MGNYTFDETVGGFLTAGVIVFLLGITGDIKWLVARVPLPIMMAMVAGTLFGWASRLVGAFKTAPAVSFVGLAGFILCKKIFKRILPVVGTMFFALVASVVMGKLKAVGIDWSISVPVFITPRFNPAACLSIGVPLALLVVCAENMQAIGVQLAIGKKPPVNAMTIVSGIGGIIAPFFGGHNCNVAGPMTAWAGCDECGDVETRYVAAVFCGLAFALTGLFAKATMSILAMLPPEATIVIIGLVLMNMIIGGLGESFGCGKFKYGRVSRPLSSLRREWFFSGLEAHSGHLPRVRSSRCCWRRKITTKWIRRYHNVKARQEGAGRFEVFRYVDGMASNALPNMKKGQDSR